MADGNIIGTPEETRAALDLKDAEIERLRARVLELEAVHEDASGAVLTERERCAREVGLLAWMPRVSGRWNETDVAHAEGFNKAKAEALVAIGA